ncbi:MAG: cytochrome c [Proteobacteria bacterium]|nr:cytochrome c [Pseudomonadota bacterium]MDA0927752.1 cytochrome c [Pseudomonadota bacterium]
MQVLSKTGLGLIVAVLFACSGDEGNGPGVGDGVDPQTQRWYGPQQVEMGRQVFADNCALCHGNAAQGLHEDWRQRLADGSFPPPPLNGSAHAWHHPLSVLLQVINEGGVPLGGQMPGFAEQLDEEQKLAAIAFFQNFWSDEIYANWQQMGGTN